MKTLLTSLLLLASSSVFAVNAGDIQAGYAELNRACGNASGRSVSKECIAASQRVQANSDQLNREIYSGMQKRDEERRRVQQEEIWREQVRRGYR